MPHLFQKDSMDKWLLEWRSGTQDCGVQVTLSCCPVHAPGFQTPSRVALSVCASSQAQLFSDPRCHHENNSFASLTGLRAVISLNRQTLLSEASKVEPLCLSFVLLTVGVGLSFCL